MSIRTDPMSLWGDGFAEDGWSDMAGVGSWDDCDPDHYIRLYPRLVPRDGTVPACLLRHLARRVAERAARLASPPATGPVATGRWTAVLSPAASLWDRLTGAVGMASDSATVAEDRAAFELLDDVLQARQGDTLDARELAKDAGHDLRRAATFAFLAGIHPAYFWPAAAATPERLAAAGWLGIVARGRPALMPADVADYFLDVILCRDGVPMVVRDAEMAGLVRASVDLEDLWRAARSRRDGRAAIVRRAGRRSRRIAGRMAGRMAAPAQWTDVDAEMVEPR